MFPVAKNRSDILEQIELMKAKVTLLKQSQSVLQNKKNNSNISSVLCCNNKAKDKK